MVIKSFSFFNSLLTVSSPIFLLSFPNLSVSESPSDRRPVHYAEAGVRSGGLVQQHSAKHGQRFRGVGQPAGDEVDAHRVPRFQRQDDVEDRQSSRDVLGLGHGFLQAFRLIARRVHSGDASVGLGQHGLNLHVLMACEDAAEEVLPSDRSSEIPWRRVKNPHK